MLVKLRYVTRRIDRSGLERWYWQRRGHKLTRLPDNPIERIAMAEQLNAVADSLAARVELARGTIGWVIQKYRDSDEYEDLSAGTVKYYRRFLRDIEALGPALPFSSFTRRAVVDFVEIYKPSQRHQAASVLKNLFKIARYYGIVGSDETVGLRLRASRPRDRIWSDEETTRWIESTESSEMITAFLLLQFTAQRPGDALKMTWPQYSGSAIRLRQEKTGTLLDVPVHPTLRDHLDGLDRSGMSLTIVARRGRPAGGEVEAVAHPGGLRI